jgi:hypothetical protein
MAEVFVEFEDKWTGPDGKAYEAQVCGRQRDDRLWEGWIEFVPVEGGPILATERETTQPNREDAVYWATGLTYTYIEGALMRLLKPLPRLQTRRARSARPAFDRPAGYAHAVLDPFEVFRESDTVLRSQLNALHDDQLRNIIRAYRISSLDAAQLNLTGRDELIAMIITAAEAQAAAGRHLERSG